MRPLHLATPICDAGIIIIIIIIIIITYIRIRHLCYSFYNRGYLVEELNSNYWLAYLVILHSLFSLSLSLYLSGHWNMLQNKRY